MGFWEDAEDFPWEKAGAKQPKDYTWKEYEALTEDQQNAFFDMFESHQAFDAWKDSVHTLESPKVEEDKKDEDKVEEETQPETTPTESYLWEKAGAK